MPLSPGTRFGNYEILAPLGKGGMGEVFRARDTKLDREVAIKVLPPAFANNPERLARFQREAKVLASLNHPNIATVHALEDTDFGKALVMELVEGSTAKGPLPLDKALKIALQVADAIEVAHEEGIVHRDIKPSNVMVTPQGNVKVLDFGLASITRSRAEGGGEDSPTLSLTMTEPGVILGTAAYMSPEQAGGENVDRHADIWSFGVLLTELLTGERLFQGATVAKVLANVISQPADLSKLPAEIPAPIRELIERCLEREVRDRLHAMGEARITIQRWLSNPSIQAVAARQVTAPGNSRLPWVVAALLALAAASFAWLYLGVKPGEQHAIAATLLPPPGGEFEIGFNPFPLPAISPDGTRMVYGAKLKDGKMQLWLRRLDSTTAQPLQGTEDAATPFWSPDGRWVAFGQGQKLKKIDTQGGPPLTIAETNAPVRGGTWNQEGVILFGTNAVSGIFRVPALGGPPQQITVPSAASARRPPEGQKGADSSHRSPWFLPDGRHFLYSGRREGDMPVYVGSLDEPGKPGKVVAQAGSPAFYAQGNLLYLRESTLMAQPFDIRRMEPSGEPSPLAEDVPSYIAPSRLPGFAVSPSGLLVYASGGFGRTRLVWKDRQGRALGDLGEPDALIGGVSLSRDGTRAAVSFTLPGGNQSEDLGIYDVARGVRSRFTFGPAQKREPVWSPDGGTIFYRSNPKGPFDLYRKAANGTGMEELVPAGSGGKTANDVSPDGKWLLYQGDRAGSPDIWVVPITGSEAKVEPRAFIQSPFTETRGKFSPDGQWVAYQSNESGQTQVYAVPFPGPGGKRQISASGGQMPRWRRDGKEIFYVSIDGQLMAAEVTSRGGTLDVGRVQKLFDGVITSRGMVYDVSADGQKFLVADDGASAAQPLSLVQNWTALLRK